MRTMYWPLATVLTFSLACMAPTQPEPEGEEREDRDRDDREDDEEEEEEEDYSDEDFCFDMGWFDCEELYDPDPDLWDCIGNLYDDYEDGYCSCEAYYDDWYWCEPAR